MSDQPSVRIGDRVIVDAYDANTRQGGVVTAVNSHVQTKFAGTPHEFQDYQFMCTVLLDSRTRTVAVEDYMLTLSIETLKGKTVARIEGGIGKGTLTFDCGYDGTFYLHHRQDCCESVYLEDIAGDLDDLVGVPILQAEEVSSETSAFEYDKATLPDCDDSVSWTFYKLGTIKGSVTLRWFGTSNGYYSESIDFDRTGSDF